MFDDYSFVFQYYSYYLYGLEQTLIVSLASIAIGILLGIIFAFMKISKVKILKMISTAYINFIRGTPMLIQVYIVYYGLSFNMPKLAAAIIAVSVNCGAYDAEIIRSGIQSIDYGQMEAGRSLGLSYFRTMQKIILPQAFTHMIPAFCNDFISTVKSTSIISVIAIHDLMFNSNVVRSMTFRAFEPLVIAALIYFTVTYVIKTLGELLERRLQIND